MILIDEKTESEVIVGDIITDFRGDKDVLVGFREPQSSSSTGRVYVRPIDSSEDMTSTREYFPGVYSLRFK